MNKQKEQYTKRIKTALKLMPIIKWGGMFFIAAFSFLGVLIGYQSGNALVALLSFFIGMMVGYFTLFGISAIFCSCPKCGEMWRSPIAFWGPGILTFVADLEMHEIETESLKCRNCKLNLRKYLIN